MGKITFLTEAQSKRLLQFRDEYYAHGTSTAPADRKRAEAAFARAYKTIGKELVPVIWVNSPVTASFMFHVLGCFNTDRFQDDIQASLRDSLGVSLETSLWASLWASLGVSLWASLETSLETSLGDSLGDSKIVPQYTYWLGQQDLYWIAFYKFCAEIGVQFDPDAAEKLDIMHEISMSCMWWYPRDGLIIACERPQMLQTDDQKRLHNDHGPAISFRDGWKIYAVHGARMPAWVFEQPEKLTIAAIHVETNTEVQRVMIERFGWDRYATECGAEIVDHDERWGTLYKRVDSNGNLILFL